MAGSVQHRQSEAYTASVKRILLCPPKRCRVRRGLIQETFNGQGPEAKQPRAEKAKATEAKAGGYAVGLHSSARAAGGTNAHEEEVGSRAFPLPSAGIYWQRAERGRNLRRRMLYSLTVRQLGLDRLRLSGPTAIGTRTRRAQRTVAKRLGVAAVARRDTRP
jgi:hypothetical protein